MEYAREAITVPLDPQLQSHAKLVTILILKVLMMHLTVLNVNLDGIAQSKVSPLLLDNAMLGTTALMDQLQRHKKNALLVAIVLSGPLLL